LDWTLVPYVRKSFWKHYKDGLNYIELNSSVLFSKDEDDIYVMLSEDYSREPIDSDVYKRFKKAYKYALDMTTKETYQAVEGMFHNLNTLQSRSGNQLPFTSINYGTCTLAEGRLVIKAILDTSIKGIGKLNRTSIFPCQIFQCMKGVNRKEGDPNYDLYRLALESTSKRLYPNYANVDWSVNEGYDKNNLLTYVSTMGKCKLAHVKPCEPRLVGVLYVRANG
jgi:ribonucleoside-triphosphate reductase